MAELKAAETILVEKEAPVAPIYTYVSIALYDDAKLGGFAAIPLDEHPIRELFLKKDRDGSTPEGGR